MSLDLVRHVHAQHPTLLQQNLNRTCYQFVALVIAALRAAGRQASHVCKSPGEGQYTPPGFPPRDVIGLDGKGYRCSGVSHDAIWCDGKQYDTVARGNDSPDPIFHPDGSPMTGEPVWDEIPAHHWRPNNPPLLDGAPVPPPAPPPAPSAILSKGAAFAALQALNAFYAAPEGLQRPGGLVRPDVHGRMVADMEAIAQWFYQLVIEGVTLDQVLAQIRASDEFRGKHP